MLATIRETHSKINYFTEGFLKAKQRTAGPTVLPEKTFKSNNLAAYLKHTFGCGRPA